jgi:short-subunit dehydrogenase
MNAGPDLAGARVLITGASSGIGAATARALAARGAVIGLVGRRQALLEEVTNASRSFNPDSTSWAVDLANLDAAEDLAREAWETLGHIDVLINNAAVPKVRPVLRLSIDDVEHAMRVNFLSPVRITLTLLPKMLERGAGTIVNVASLGGRLGIQHEAAYSASKFALTGWSEAIAMDLHDTPIRVRLIQPGAIDTDIWNRPGEEKALYIDGPKESPEMVAEGIVDAIGSERFEHYLPDMKSVVTFKDSDIDSYIAMAAQRSGSETQGESQ